MDATPRLRRVKSLKSALSARARRDSVLDEEDSLPPNRPVKPTLLQVHVTTDDIRLRPTSVPPRTSSLEVPSSRNTWPQGLRERRPGHYAFDEIPTLTRTPWERDRSLRSGPRRSRSTRRSSSESSQLFAHFPREILHCILNNLRDSRKSESALNVTSYRADLRKLCATNKQWHRVAREHLYREIWLPWDEGRPLTRQQGCNIPSRSSSKLKLLLRTLRETPGLAYLVRQLRIPSAMIREFDLETFTDVRRTNGPLADPMLPALCDVIRRCPNLQSLHGHNFLACDSTTDLLASLASRPKLKQHVWSLPRSQSGWQTLLWPGAFVDHHAQWRQVETLALCRDGSFSDCLGLGAVTALLQRLPSLKHLMLKGLPRSEFHNGTLLMLPALKSLRLEGLPGVTDQGMQQLVYSRLAMSLERFSLIGLELTSLRTIQALLDNLPRLKRFSLIQETSPELQEVLSFTGSTFSISSPSLEHLCWNAMLPGNATAILANAIAANKFPALRTIKIPCDYDGAVQKLCRPIQQRSLTGTEVTEYLDEVRTSGLEYRKYSRFLEMEAQLRAKRARKDSVFSVTVEDEDGVEQFQWNGSYLGSISSKIEYEIEAEIKGSLFSYARVEDLARPRRLEGGFEMDVGLEVLF